MDGPRLEVRPAGDRGWYVRLVKAGGRAGQAGERDGEHLAEVQASLRRLAGWLEQHHPRQVSAWLLAYDTLLVEYAAECGAGTGLALRLGLRDALAQLGTAAAAAQGAARGGRLHRIPVRYGGEDGPDLAALAAELGLSQEELVRAHAGQLYTVFAVGFAPGFPYLGPLPRDWQVARLATPRSRVPAGSVGVAGRQTGIYPVTSPGGWRLIGRTPVPLFDPARQPPVRLQVGDHVAFQPLSKSQAGSPEEADEPGDAWPAATGVETPAGAALRPGLRVVRPGLLTTVQDAGRLAWRRFGFALCGALDRESYRWANWLVGNEAGAAALEITVVGPVLEFLGECVFSLTGADLAPRLDGEELPMWQACTARPGQRLSFAGRRTGARAYLAVGGGFAVPAVGGSRSTDLRAGVGGLAGRALRSGDILPFWAASQGARVAGAPAAPRGVPAPRDGRRVPPERRPRWPQPAVVRIVPGPDAGRLPAEAAAVLYGSLFRIDPASNRMGLRLGGQPLPHVPAADAWSEPVRPGLIQVPPGGQPVVLLADAQTMGGYLRPAAVIEADLDRLGQLIPGEAVRFLPVSLDTAWQLQREYCGRLARLERGDI